MQFFLSRFWQGKNARVWTKIEKNLNFYSRIFLQFFCEIGYFLHNFGAKIQMWFWVKLKRREQFSQIQKVHCTSIGLAAFTHWDKSQTIVLKLDYEKNKIEIFNPQSASINIVWSIWKIRKYFEIFDIATIWNFLEK